jgi:hypothetical protein
MELANAPRHSRIEDDEKNNSPKPQKVQPRVLGLFTPFLGQREAPGDSKLACRPSGFESY